MFNQKIITLINHGYVCNVATSSNKRKMFKDVQRAKGRAYKVKAKRNRDRWMNQ